MHIYIYKCNDWINLENTVKSINCSHSSINCKYILHLVGDKPKKCGRVLMCYILIQQDQSEDVLFISLRFLINYVFSTLTPT